jgi:DNA-binding response OmpR family regulator
MDKLRKSILMIEDDPNDVALFRRALSKSNLDTDVIVAEDGDVAIHWLESKLASPSPEPADWPWFILLDIKLPRTSGLEVLEWLRRQPAGCRLPVIALTSSREREDIARAYRLGVNSYLVKPVSFDQLKDMVRAMHHYWMELNERPEIP